MSAFPNAQRAVAVTPSDAAAGNMSACEALWIGVGGTISFIPADPNFPSNTLGTGVSTTVPAGLFPVKVLRVNATGTTATGILALS